MKKHKRKKPFNYNYIVTPIIAFIIIGVLYYGGINGWFKSVINVDNILPKSDEKQEPAPNAPVYSTCSQVCSSNGFTNYYNFVSSCKPGENKITYGYPNQAPILTCCCYNEITTPSGTCTETDGGKVPTKPGTTTGDGVARTDYCFDSTTVYEYWCDGNEWNGAKINCNAGEVCLSSRSGGYCYLKTWKPGDTVTSGSGSGSLIGAENGYAEIDLSDYGLASGGNCQLGAQLSVNWNYGNDKCVGIMGAQGMYWEFFDSLGLEYSRLDAAPTSWNVDLHPRGHILSWDGHTPWKATARENPGNTPECIINYQYTIRVYIYDCI